MSAQMQGAGSVELTSGGVGGTIKLDGVDISKMVKDVTVRVGYDRPTIVELELFVNVETFLSANVEWVAFGPSGSGRGKTPHEALRALADEMERRVREEAERG